MTMRPGILSQLIRDNRGASAVEMAMVAPFLILLTFATVELGYLFYSEHILAKAVRDGARYAARQPFSAYDMGACALSSDAESRTRRLVRTAQLATAGRPGRLPNWNESDEASTVAVTVVCDNSGSYAGVYATNSNVAAAVTVQASVPYTSLFGLVGFATSGLILGSQSQAAVTGA